MPERKKLDDMVPSEIVRSLNEYVIGQDEAKRTIAIAIRNRVRRKRLPEDVRDEVSPKNILMIGPTGVGKTEIARRIAKLANAPFIKVEATKYTEVGYVGRDVESMVRDLAAASISMVREEMAGQKEEEVERRVSRSLELTGLSAFRLRVPQTLSGGEKERAQLSGALALSPKVLIFDESFSMLDSVSRREVMGIVSPMRKDHLLVFITHDAEEAVDADTVIIMAKGRIIASGNPHDVLSRSDLLLSASIRPPFAVRMRDALKKRGIDAGSPLTMEELEAALWN